MSRAPRLGFWAIACLACVVGCASPIDAPSAFEGERFLCDEAHLAEFDALVGQCRDARFADPASCDGILSFKGVMDSEPVVVDAPVVEAHYTDIPTSTHIRRTFEFTANAPYFMFRLGMAFEFYPKTGMLGEPDPLELSHDNINIEARGANYLTPLVRTQREVEQTTQDEVRVRFSSDLSRGGAIDACFHIFPTALR